MVRYAFVWFIKYSMFLLQFSSIMQQDNVHTGVKHSLRLGPWCYSPDGPLSVAASFRSLNLSLLHRWLCDLLFMHSPPVTSHSSYTHSTGKRHWQQNKKFNSAFDNFVYLGKLYSSFLLMNIASRRNLHWPSAWLNKSAVTSEILTKQEGG